MKNLLWIVFLGLAFPIFFISCGADSRTYARQIDGERALIDDFIRRQGIQVTSRMPSDSEFLYNPNLFFRSSSGLLYRLERKSDPEVSPQDTIIDGVRVFMRWIEYTLTERSDTADFRSPQVFPFDNSFIFNRGAATPSVPVAFIEAIGYMKRSGTKARLIVPHRIGSNPMLVRPLGYDLEITFRVD